MFSVQLSHAMQWISFSHCKRKQFHFHFLYHSELALARACLYDAVNDNVYGMAMALIMKLKLFGEEDDDDGYDLKSAEKILL